MGIMNVVNILSISFYTVLFNGIRDGWNQPDGLNVGLTYDDAYKNELYDRGVNFGQSACNFLYGRGYINDVTRKD